jgi:hypothetical protein
MGMRRWVGVLLAAVLTVFAGAAPALGAPALTPSSVISSARVRASEPAVAVSADGRTLATWVAVRGELATDVYPSCGAATGYGTIEARLGTVAHGWRGVQVLGVDAESPIAAVGVDGTAAVAWCPLTKSRRSLYVSIANPGRPFGRPRLVLTSGEFPVGHPEGIEVQPDGRVVLIWSKTLEYELTPLKTRIEFALLQPHRGRPVVGAVSDSSPEETGVSVAQTEAGDVLVDFPALSGSAQDVAQLHQNARAFAAPQPINPAGNTVMRSASVSAGPGGAALAFTASEGGTVENAMVERQPNGAFGSPVLITRQQLEPTGRQFEPRGARVAFPAGGERVAVWLNVLGVSNIFEVVGPGPQIVMAAVRPALVAGFQAPVRLSVGAGRSGEPLIASAGTDTVVLWVQDEPGCTQRAYSAVGAVGTALAQVRALSGRFVVAKGECATGSGQLALAGSGRDAIAGWIQNSSLHVTTIEGGVGANASRASSLPSDAAPGKRVQPS